MSLDRPHKGRWKVTAGCTWSGRPYWIVTRVINDAPKRLEFVASGRSARRFYLEKAALNKAAGLKAAAAKETK